MNFPVRINCIIISTDICKNKQFVLSTKDDDFVFPSFLLEEAPNNLHQKLVDFVRSHALVSPMECIPQLINLHSPVLTINEGELNVVYGFVITNTNSLNNCYWKEFNLLNMEDIPPVYSAILEVIQKLQ